VPIINYGDYVDFAVLVEAMLDIILAAVPMTGRIYIILFVRSMINFSAARYKIA